MTDKVLSQAEVECLTRALDDRPTLLATSQSRRHSSAIQSRESERVDEDLMRALKSLHDGFSRHFASALSDLLRTSVNVKLTHIDQMTYGEFILRRDYATCSNLLKAEPLAVNWFLDISPSIAFPIIDRLLGGGNQQSQIARRPLTEIETRLASRIAGVFAEELQSAWRDVQELNLSVEKTESNAQQSMTLPPTEVIVLIGFELKLGVARGSMDLCIPFRSIEKIAGQLNTDPVANAGQTPDDPSVELVVTLAESKIASEDLADLQVGDIITTEKGAHELLDVKIDGAAQFRASPGSLNGHKAIQVQEVVD